MPPLILDQIRNILSRANHEDIFRVINMLYPLFHGLASDAGELSQVSPAYVQRVISGGIKNDSVVNSLVTIFVSRMSKEGLL